MAEWLNTPTLAFLIVLFTAYVLSLLFSRLSARVKKHAQAQGEPYACGEDTYNENAQLDYSQFFPFAFFFTIAHVATLIITTVPVENILSYVMPVIYLLGGVASLFILLRR